MRATFAGNRSGSLDRRGTTAVLARGAIRPAPSTARGFRLYPRSRQPCELPRHVALRTCRPARYGRTQQDREITNEARGGCSRRDGYARRPGRACAGQDGLRQSLTRYLGAAGSREVCQDCTRAARRREPYGAARLRCLPGRRRAGCQSDILQARKHEVLKPGMWVFAVGAHDALR
jgi:hypothetical protein